MSVGAITHDRRQYAYWIGNFPRVAGAYQPLFGSLTSCCYGSTIAQIRCCVNTPTVCTACILLTACFVGGQLCNSANCIMLFALFRWLSPLLRAHVCTAVCQLQHIVLVRMGLPPHQTGVTKGTYGTKVPPFPLAPKRLRGMKFGNTNSLSKLHSCFSTNFTT